MESDAAWVTQADAAKRLGGRSASFMFRLRRDKEVVWIPGRPVMIEVASLDAYTKRQQEAAQCPAKTKVHGSSSTTRPGFGKSAGPKKTAEASAFQRAREIFKKRAVSSRVSSWKTKPPRT